MRCKSYQAIVYTCPIVKDNQSCLVSGLCALHANK